MKLTLFGIVVEIYRKNVAFTPQNVERLAWLDSYYTKSAKIARIKAARVLNKRMSLVDAKDWVERHFTE